MKRNTADRAAQARRQQKQLPPIARAEGASFSGAIRRPRPSRDHASLLTDMASTRCGVAWHVIHPIRLEIETRRMGTNNIIGTAVPRKPTTLLFIATSSRPIKGSSSCSRARLSLVTTQFSSSFSCSRAAMPLVAGSCSSADSGMQRSSILV